MPPLPDDATNVPYSELLLHTRQLAWKANESFYRDDWRDLLETAAELDKASKLLPDTKEIPAHLTSTLAAKTQALAGDTDKLRQAAKNKDEVQANEAIQRIHMKIRELRFEKKEGPAQ